MKYYKCTGCFYFAVRDEEYLPNAKATMLLCKFAIYNKYEGFNFSFKDSYFRFVPDKYNLTNISEKDFKEAVKEITPKIWKEVNERDKGEPFALDPIEMMTRKAYSYYFLDGDEVGKFGKFCEEL